MRRNQYGCQVHWVALKGIMAKWVFWNLLRSFFFSFLVFVPFVATENYTHFKVSQLSGWKISWHLSLVAVFPLCYMDWSISPSCVSFSEGAHLLGIFRLLFWTGVDIKNTHNRKSPRWKIYTLTHVTFVLPVFYISVYISLYFCVRFCLFFSTSLPPFFLIHTEIHFSPPRPPSLSQLDPHYRRLFCRVHWVEVLHLVSLEGGPI